MDRQEDTVLEGAAPVPEGEGDRDRAAALFRERHRARVKTALAKAQALGLDLLLHPAHDSPWHYRMISESEPGTYYHVWRIVRSGSVVYLCSCPAGQHGWPCKHKAALWLAFAKRQGLRIKEVA